MLPQYNPVSEDAFAGGVDLLVVWLFFSLVKASLSGHRSRALKQSQEHRYVRKKVISSTKRKRYDKYNK